MSNTLKVLHDRMLAERPDDASHDADACPICTPGHETASAASSTGGSVADKTYTQEEHDALLAQVEELSKKVADQATASAESTMEAKIAAATAEVEAKITDLQSQLDAAVLETEAAKQERDSTVAYLEQLNTEAAAAVELASRKEERVAQVKEVASFPDEYLEANADRFAAMSDEAFQAALEDWKTIAPKKASGTKEEVPSVTAMTAARTSTDNGSVLSEVMNLRFTGVDVRTI